MKTSPRLQFIYGRENQEKTDRRKAGNIAPDLGNDPFRAPTG
jgi:hypothetical protein